MKGQTLKERFDQLWTPEPFSGCWLWIGSCDPKGYGRFMFNGVKGFAHRAAWLIRHGSLSSIQGKLVCHKCDTPCCVNPEHLFAVTHRDNLYDQMAKGRFVKRASGMIWRTVRDGRIKSDACSKGHPRNDENLYITPAGNAQCRACKRRRNKESRIRQGVNPPLICAI